MFTWMISRSFAFLGINYKLLFRMNSAFQVTEFGGVRITKCFMHLYWFQPSLFCLPCSSLAMWCAVLCNHNLPAKLNSNWPTFNRCWCWFGCRWWWMPLYDESTNNAIQLPTTTYGMKTICGHLNMNEIRSHTQNTWDDKTKNINFTYGKL